MTAAFDATRGTDQRFTDALSGSDGTADPSVLMPVLDVYPDALSSPMPSDLVPVVVPVPVAQPRTDPAVGSARQPGGRLPAAQRGPQRPASAPAWQRPQPSQRPGAGRSSAAAPRPVAPRPVSASPGAPRPVAPSPPAGRRPVAAAAPPANQQAPRTFNWQGMSVSAADVAAMFRSGMPGQPPQVDRESFQATHPQSMGSTSPNAVAPAAPMASQYSTRGAARNTARDQAQERRRVTNTVRRRSSSTWAVLVFIFVILFATGIGQRIVEAITELLNR